MPPLRPVTPIGIYNLPYSPSQFKSIYHILPAFSFPILLFFSTKMEFHNRNPSHSPFLLFHATARLPTASFPKTALRPSCLPSEPGFPQQNKPFGKKIAKKSHIVLSNQIRYGRIALISIFLRHCLEKSWNCKFQY